MTRRWKLLVVANTLQRYSMWLAPIHLIAITSQPSSTDRTPRVNLRPRSRLPPYGQSFHRHVKKNKGNVLAESNPSKHSYHYCTYALCDRCASQSSTSYFLKGRPLEKISCCLTQFCSHTGICISTVRFYRPLSTFRNHEPSCVMCSLLNSYRRHEREPRVELSNPTNVAPVFTTRPFDLSDLGPVNISSSLITVCDVIRRSIEPS